MSDQELIERDPELHRWLVTRRSFLGSAAMAGLSLSAVLQACGGTSGSSNSTAEFAPAKYKWRMGSTVGPGNAIYTYETDMAEQIRQKTNGAVHIDLFPNSQLGSEADNFQNLQNGSMAFDLVTSSVANATVPETLLFALPYVFSDPAKARKAYTGAAKATQEQKLEAIGIHVINWVNLGIRHIGAKKALNTPSDMQGVKIRVIQSPMFVALFKAFQSVPTPLAPADVYSALQQGLISAYDQPLTGVLSFKWYEVGNHVTLSYHSWSIAFLGVNKQLWDSMPAKIKTGVMEAADIASAKFDSDQLAIDSQAETDLKGKGVEVLKPSLDPWIKAGRSIYPDFASQVGGMSVIDKLISSQ